MISTICCAIIGIHLATAHIDADKELNGFNPGIYAQADNGIIVGTYFNSLKRQTAYVGYNYQTRYVDITTALGSGYNNSVVPMVMPSIKIGAARVMLLPKTDITASYVVHFSIEKRFK